MVKSGMALYLKFEVPCNVPLYKVVLGDIANMQHIMILKNCRNTIFRNDAVIKCA